MRYLDVPKLNLRMVNNLLVFWETKYLPRAPELKHHKGVKDEINNSIFVIAHSCSKHNRNLWLS